MSFQLLGNINYFTVAVLFYDFTIRCFVNDICPICFCIKLRPITCELDKLVKFFRSFLWVSPSII